MTATKKTKKRLYTLIPVLALLFLISTAMLSGTFAKYTSEYSGQDTALVARWSFTGKIDGGEFNEDLPIWDHDYAENIYANDGDPLIAPGVAGELLISFNYDADVDAGLTLGLEKSGDASDTVPIQYSVDNFATIYYDLTELENAILDAAVAKSDGKITGSGGAYIIEETATSGEPTNVGVTVNWRWPYEVAKHDKIKMKAAGFLDGATDEAVWTDADDTAIGLASAEGASRDAYTLELTISATQKIPE